jgi:hypothetical protein
MALAPYATLPEFKTWAGLKDTDDDLVATGTLEAVTRWIDDYCDRHFWQDGETGSEVARTFSPHHPRSFDLYSFADLVSVTEVATDESGDGTYETVWDASDYQLWPVNQPTGRPYTRIEAIGNRTFPIRSTPGSLGNRVRITGIWGWPDVPEPVHQACLLQASRVMKRRNSPEGITGFGNEFGHIRVSNRLDVDVQLLLDPYRRVGVLVA